MKTELPEKKSGEDEHVLNVAMANDTALSEATQTTTSSHSVNGVTPSNFDDDGDFIYIVMAIVGGIVITIIAIIIICFIAKSRRRQRQNIRIYRENRDRPHTVSLEVIDRDDQLTDVVNGVNNSMYSRILPISVPDRSSEQHSSFHSSGNREPITNQRDSRKSQQDENIHKSSHCTLRTGSVTSSSSKQETPSSPVNVIVYENTKVSNTMFLKASDKPKQVSMPNLNDSSKIVFDKRKGSQKQTKSVRVDGDYETAFPILNNIPGNNNSIRNDNDEGSAMKNEFNPMKDQDTDPSITIEHMNSGKVHDRNEITGSFTELSDSGNRKLGSEVKPKPKARQHINKTSSEINKGNDLHHYRQFSAKKKRDTFKQAKLLGTVPPPCNKNTYVNVPSDSKDSSSENLSQDGLIKHIQNLKRKTSNSVSSGHENSEDRSNDYVNVPEKKCTKQAIEKNDGVEASEHFVIKENPNSSSSGESNQYENVPEKKLTNYEPRELNDKKSNDCPNITDKKSNSSKLQETIGNNSKDYVNIPDKKSIFSLSKGNISEKKLEKAAKDVDVNNKVNEYANIPENISNNVASDDLLENSSDYEDPGSVLKLKKSSISKDERATTERHDYIKKEKSRHPKNVHHLNTTVPNTETVAPYNTKPETRSYHKGFDTKPNKAKFAAKSRVAARGRTVSESPTNKDVLDYENEEAMIQLKLSVKKLLRRGLSTPSLETSGICGNLRSGQSKKKPLALSGDSNVSDDETYLEMDKVKKDEDLYLQMNSPNESIYVPMTSPDEDQVYIPMNSGRSIPVPNRSHTLHPLGNEDIGFGYRTCPKPCGGARSGIYDNFSEQPTHYANFFRSKSTSNINEYSYADTKPVVKF